MPEIAVPDFQEIERLDEGGSSVVYKAHHGLTDTDVAIKVAKDPVYAEQVRIEAKTQYDLSNPGKPNERIVEVIIRGDIEGDPSRPYFAMEFVEDSLRKRLKRDKVLPVEDSLKILEQCAKAINDAHEMGFVHGDVKPENILITNDGAVKVTDFGLGRKYVDNSDDLSLSSSLRTTSDNIAGTVGYIAPEVLKEKKMDARSDIYSLGQVGIEISTGDLGEVGTGPKEKNPEIPEWFDKMLLKMVKRNPDDRYQAMADVLEELELGGKSVVIDPETGEVTTKDEEQPPEDRICKITLRKEIFNSIVSEIVKRGIDRVDISMFDEKYQSKIYKAAGNRYLVAFWSGSPFSFFSGDESGNKGGQLEGKRARMINYLEHELNTLKSAGRAYLESGNKWANEAFANRILKITKKYIDSLETYHRALEEGTVTSHFFEYDIFTKKEADALINYVPTSRARSLAELLEIGKSACDVAGYKGGKKKLAVRALDYEIKKEKKDPDVLSVVDGICTELDDADGLAEVAFMYVNSGEPGMHNRGRAIYRKLGRDDYAIFLEREGIEEGNA